MNAFFIISQNDLALKNTENIEQVASIYSSWFTRIFENIGKITGDAINLNWGPETTVDK